MAGLSMIGATMKHDLWRIVEGVELRLETVPPAPLGRVIGTLVPKSIPISDEV
jgi:hypothetical protein